MNALPFSRRHLLRAFSSLAFTSAALAKNRFVVGSSPTGVPFSFIDMKTYGLTGAMVDITKAIAEDAGFDIDLQVTAFGSLIPALMARRIDIISAAMLKTARRAAVVAFSDPVYSYGGALAIRSADKRKYSSLKNLAGMRVGAQVGTRYVEQLQAIGPGELKTYDNLIDILRDLRFQRIDAGYGDAPILTYALKRLRWPEVRLAASFTPPTYEGVCLIVRRDENRLLSQINTSISNIKSSRIKPILERWDLH